MRSFDFSARFAAATLAFALCPVSAAQAQAESAPPERPTAIAGLYRLENPKVVAPATIKFLRLLPDGRSRIETLRIDAASQRIGAYVDIEPVARRRWRLVTRTPGLSPQLCFEVRDVESCSAFHVELPRGDLLLFGPDANWGSPTLILRRESNLSL